MSATDLDQIDTAEALELLRASRVARVGFVAGGGEPWVLPVNIAVDEEGGIVFRTADDSVLAALPGQRVAVEVDGHDDRLRRGWFVMVHGVAREITSAGDPAAVRLHRLAVDTWAPPPRDRWIAIVPLSISGRRVDAGANGIDWFPGIPSS